jgi:hypothetical protein
MDGELLRWLYHRLLHDPTLARTPGCTYGDGVVLLAHFYAVLNNASLRWASAPPHWPPWCRATVRLPSYSQLNKRLKTASAARAMSALEAELRDGLPRTAAKVADGMPLVIGGFSHDPDARRGRVPDGWANGYKLHVLADGAAGAIDAHALTPLDAGEATVLRRDLVLPRRVDLRGCTLRADANYDSNPCYAAAADAGGRLVAPRRKPRRGLGHHAQHPDRLRAIDELERTCGGRAAHRRARNRVEQCFAQLTNLPFGLFALPNFVRRLPRVRRWVAAKIMLYHLHKVLSLARARAA